MKMKKLLIILLVLTFVCGCTNIENYNYDDLVNMMDNKPKSANTFRKGYKYYVPKNIQVINAGNNFAILKSENIVYSLYVDLISYYNDNEITNDVDNSAVYSKNLKVDDKSGYVEIKLQENNQYLIEIMYNYAKIEVMVDEDLLNKALLNSINILNSVKYYDDEVIKELLETDELSETLEKYEIFNQDKVNSNILNSSNKEESKDDSDDMIDTDFIN